MADFEVQVEDGLEDTPIDVEMAAAEHNDGENEADVDATAPEREAGLDVIDVDDDIKDDEIPTEIPPVRKSYVDHLRSPIVELLVGNGEEETLLFAHQELLVQSTFFADACAQFRSDGTDRRIDLSDESLDAVGCFLEYLYTGEYFPQRIPNTHSLVTDPSVPVLDATGDQLLKHARVYTLADKFGMMALKSLGLSKIHCVKASAKGELAYARYVYSTTSRDDETIRKPVASFWAHRSHVLRADAEDEFRQMCLEFPQFGFDVLTRVLDEKLKNERAERPHAGPGRKRVRQSQG